MPTEESVSAARLRWVPYGAGLLAVVVGGGHMLAWLTGAMAHVPASTIVMKTNAALALLLCGAALVLASPRHAPPVRRRLAAACAVLPCLLGLATLGEHAFGWNLGIDQFLAAEPAGAAATASPNRMGPPASLSSALLGFALLLLARVRPAGRRGRAFQEPLALAVALLGLLSIIGYLYEAAALYGIARLTGIAWPTALSFLVLAVGVLCARPGQGLMGRLTADDAGGAIARALLGPMVLLPVALGWVRLNGERLGWFDAPMGTALMMVLFIVTFSSLLLFASRRVSAASEALRDSERDARRQKELLAVTLASIGDAVIVTDAAGAVTFLNAEAERLTGWTDGDARGKPLGDVFVIVNEQTRETLESPVDRILRLGQVVGLGNHTLLVARGGREIPIDDSGAPIRQADGEVRGVILVFRDITDRKGAADALAESERRYRGIVETAEEGIATHDADGTIEYVNQRMADMLGYRREELVGMSSLEFVDEHEREPVIDARRILSERGSFSTERKLRRKDGSTLWTLSNVTPRRDGAGHFLGYLAMHTDVTASKQAREALGQANAALAEADRRKDEFIAILSHELRNPLAPIRYALPLVRAQQLDEPGARAVAVIERQVAHLTRLVDDLLDVSRITRGKIELHPEYVTLGSVLAAAAEAASPAMIAARHTFSLHVPDEPIWLHVDPARVAQVVTNLLNNSARYTDRGGTIELKAERDDGQAVIIVGDNGIGIPPGELGTVFEMFRQVERADNSLGGLGIGLALARSLVHMHDGTIEARSAGIGQGAEFVVRLPIAADITVRNGDEAQRPSALPAGGRRLRVLVVDDNADFVEMLALIVEHAGHEVRKALDGPSAVSAALAYRPHIVFLDLGLPVMSGIEVARELRRHDEMAAVRLVALTGWGQAEDRRRTSEAGFQYHLTKPTEPLDVERLLNDVASGAAS